jgi:hypothetical protein
MINLEDEKCERLWNIDTEWKKVCIEKDIEYYFRVWI